MKRTLQLRLTVLVVFGGLACFLWQKETTRRLEHDLAARRETVREVQRLRGENQRLREVVAVSDDASAAERMKAEITRLRQEMTTLERKRPATPPQARPTVGQPTAQPTKDHLADQDVVRVSDFKDVGQATPGAAFQTFVWAVAQDDLAALKPLLHLSPAGQEKLRKVWNELPAESRGRFKEPEQIMMMLLALDVLDDEAFKIASETPQTGGEVLLRVSGVKQGRVQGEKRIPLRQGAMGWQLVIPDQMIESIPQAIDQASLYVAPPVAR